MVDLREELRRFSSLEHKKVVLLAVFLGFLFLIGVYIGQRLGKAPVTQKVKKEKAPSPTVTIKPSAQLKIDLKEGEAKVGETLVFSVVLSRQPAGAVDAVVLYDKDKLRVVEIRKGKDFESLIRKKIDAKEGRLTVSASISPTSQKRSAVGEVFQIVAVPLKAGKVGLRFDLSKTIVAFSGQNVLGLAIGKKLVVRKR